MVCPFARPAHSGPQVEGASASDRESAQRCPVRRSWSAELTDGSPGPRTVAALQASLRARVPRCRRPSARTEFRADTRCGMSIATGAGRQTESSSTERWRRAAHAGRPRRATSRRRPRTSLPIPRSCTAIEKREGGRSTRPTPAALELAVHAEAAGARHRGEDRGRARARGRGCQRTDCANPAVLTEDQPRPAAGRAGRGAPGGRRPRAPGPGAASIAATMATSATTTSSSAAARPARCSRIG